MNPVVITQGLHQRYGENHVLRGIDFQLLPGELVALYGASGSGKTTLLNLIGTLDQPSQGKIDVLGEDVIDMPDHARTRLRRKQMGFIFQSATLLFTYTAYENIELALRLAGYRYFERARRTKAVLHAVGLTAWSDHRPDEMSGGQQQRIAIARALANSPKLVLADEPSNGLDSTNTRRIFELFRQVASSEGTAFLIVTHDPMIESFVDRTFHLQDGQLKRITR
jgi:ABC-type lipoprotein export system ATPase subunit